MDYGDVVVHIFHEDTRGYYDLETLWIDAARVPVATPPGYAD
jgi:ribosome-associated protein